MRRPQERQQELGIYLAEQRNMLNETVTSLAHKSQVAASTLSDIERGVRRPRRDTLRKSSGPLGIDPNQLFVRAYLMQELRPVPAVAEEPESFILFSRNVTRQQERMLDEYLTFLQLRPYLSRPLEIQE